MGDRLSDIYSDMKVPKSLDISTTPRAIIGYIQLINLHGGDIDSLINWIKEEGSEAQKREDLSTALVLKGKIKNNPYVLKIIKAIVEAFSKDIENKERNQHSQATPVHGEKE